MFDTLSPPAPPVGEQEIRYAIRTLQRYKQGKAALEARIVEEERWWKLRHWDVIRGGSAPADRPEPASAWLFNSIVHKHADLMDSYPYPAVLPRTEQDRREAALLEAILPVLLEKDSFEQTYSDAAWYKLKHGAAAKGCFWDSRLENGLGDAHIAFIDLLNLFWEPGITHLQDSRDLFIVSLRDRDLLEEEYPRLRGRQQAGAIDVKQYVYDDGVDLSDKYLVVDWYYKRAKAGGGTALHYCKFCGETLLYASENDPRYALRGYYDHGLYPVTLDVLFPEEGTPVGFGYIAVMKSPQMYIDKLQQSVLENAVMAAKPRFWAKKTVGVNLEQFLDWGQPIVEVEGDLSEERLQPIRVEPVSGNTLGVLQMKIEELKETSANRDVSQGGTAGGVTAAAAIAALQEAGSKTSRDMIAASYRAFAAECSLLIALIRQFYMEERDFRVTGEGGGMSFLRYGGGERAGGRAPVFDLAIKPHKRSPYSRMAQNELAKELYQLGFFKPELADQSLAALELMEFDGIQRVRALVRQGRQAAPAEGDA